MLVRNALLQVQSSISPIPLSQYTDTCFVVSGTGIMEWMLLPHCYRDDYVYGDALTKR